MQFTVLYSVAQYAAEVKPLLSCSYHSLQFTPIPILRLRALEAAASKEGSIDPSLLHFWRLREDGLKSRPWAPFAREAYHPLSRIRATIESPNRKSKNRNSDYQNSDSENSENRYFEQIDRVERLENPETPSTCRCAFSRWGIRNTLIISILCSVVETDP